MQPEDTTIVKMFRGNSNQFIIPRFQRDYSWETKGQANRSQIPMFWEDILCAYDSEQKHFTGSIITMTHPETNVGVSSFIVIDGQQRLLTTSVLVRVFKEFLRGEDHQKIINGILKNNVENRFGHLKMIVSDKDRDVYEKIMDDGPFKKKFLSEHKIGQCYAYFETRLRDIVENPEDNNNISLEKLFDTIVTKLQVISINVDQEDPSVIFESVNSKRAELTRLDLLRNFILMQVGSAEKNIEADPEKMFYERHWIPFEKSFNNDNDILENFIRHYLMMNGKRVASRDMYVASKNRITEIIKNNPAKKIEILTDFVDDMTRIAGYYRYIVGTPCSFDNMRKNHRNLISTTVFDNYAE